MLTTLEYYRSKDDGLWYFHLKAPNGGILVQSGGHITEAECLNGIDMLRLYADVAVLVRNEEMSTEKISTIEK
jgi:uncharacterized protein YegP (UPF0339 family)